MVFLSLIKAPLWKQFCEMTWLKVFCLDRSLLLILFYEKFNAGIFFSKISIAIFDPNASDQKQPLAVLPSEIWTTSWENQFMLYANNGADQPAHLHSLISAFVVRCQDSIILLVSISEISSLYLASVSSFCRFVLPGRKPRRQVFSWWGSFVSNSYTTVSHAQLVSEKKF